MAKAAKLTMAQAEKTGRGHPQWEAMNTAQRREYVRKVNVAIVEEAKAQAYFDSFRPREPKKMTRRATARKKR